MKNKTLFILGLCASISTNAFAETETKKSSDNKTSTIVVSKDLTELEFNNTIYVPKTEMNVDFFIGMETALFSYTTSKISVDDFSIEETELNFNNNILNNISLLFGFDIGNSLRLGFNAIHHSTDTDAGGFGDSDTDYSIGAYGLTLDTFLNKNKFVSPFFRLGIGYLNVEEGTTEFSSAMFNLGAGVNFNISEHFFSYAVLEYAFLPKTEIDDTDVEIKASSLGMSLGLGYKF